jgi:hypothetical protein
MFSGDMAPRTFSLLKLTAVTVPVPIPDAMVSPPLVPLILRFAPLFLTPPVRFFMALLPIWVTTYRDARRTDDHLGLKRRDCRRRYRTDCDASQ